MLKEFLISLEWRKQSCNGFLQDIPLGRNIQNIRMAKNMTQMQVVEKMQLIGSTMSRSTYANIESGRRNIKASDLKVLQTVFNVDFAEFFKD